jgi:hypothetical protein
MLRVTGGRALVLLLLTGLVVTATACEFDARPRIRGLEERTQSQAR